MTHEEYMHHAIEAAKKSAHGGGAPIGAIIIHDTTGEVVATGESLVAKHHDPSAHAELDCIRRACKKLGLLDLTGYTLYSTLEPCHMCLSCAAWACLPTMYFGTYSEDVPLNAYEVRGYDAMQAASLMQLASGQPMLVRGGILREECTKLLQGYHHWVKG